jgi:hypothetical protein
VSTDSYAKLFLSLKIRALSAPRIGPDPLSDEKAPPFIWSEKTEAGQSEQYLQYLRELIGFGDKVSVVKAPKDLLNIDIPALPFVFSGTTDALVYLGSSTSTRETDQMIIVFECKKTIWFTVPGKHRTALRQVRSVSCRVARRVKRSAEALSARC